MSGLATTGRVRAWVTVVLRVDSSCGDGNGGLYCIATCQWCRRKSVVACVTSRTKQSRNGGRRQKRRIRSRCLARCLTWHLCRPKRAVASRTGGSGVRPSKKIRYDSLYWDIAGMMVIIEVDGAKR
jgi:hypothetical protein